MAGQAGSAAAKGPSRVAGSDRGLDLARGLLEVFVFPELKDSPASY